MLELPSHDDILSDLEGATLHSEREPDIRYRIERTLGAGGMSIAFFALRLAPDGETPVVLKVLRPSVVRESERAAALIVRKEAVALGRLNERIPTTPFVVRLVDTGVVSVRSGGELTLPWLAVEYVHGGPDGTTLAERVQNSVRTSGFAFDSLRAAHAIECLAAGVSAIHEVGVIHRDLTPGNVLCCSHGDDEIFKIADFGIARPAGMAATFGGVIIGTPGYAPPEQFGLDDARVASWSDVFSLACVVYYLLAGEEYFPVHTPAEGVLLVRKPERLRLADARSLSPQLRNRTAACEAIDTALARATSVEPLQRPQSAQALAQLLVPALRPTTRIRPSDRRRRTLAAAIAPTMVAGWKWGARHNAGDDRVIRRVAWDGDGHCLAATERGLSFWNGTRWLDAPPGSLPNPTGIRFARKIAASTWLIGGDRGFLAIYGPDGLEETLGVPDASVSFEDASGDLADLGVLIATRDDGSSLLYAVSARRWVRPAALSRASSISSLSRLADDAWIVTGRSKQGEGIVLRYTPLMWQVERVEASETRAYLASAAQPERGVAVIVGTAGRSLRIDGDETTTSLIAGEPHLSAVGLDAAGRAWAASLGRLWLQRPDGPAWNQVWHDPAWNVPFVSVFADIGHVIAMSADGGILEGRLERLAE